MVRTLLQKEVNMQRRKFHRGGVPESEEGSDLSSTDDMAGLFF